MKCFPPALAFVANALALAGCAVGPVPANLAGSAFQPQQQVAAKTACIPATPVASRDLVSASDLGGDVSLLSPGDRVRVRVAGDADRLTGVYVVGTDGKVELPGAGAVPLIGLDEARARAAVHAALLRAGQIRPLANIVDVRLIEAAGVSALVSGAVFEPGAVRVGERAQEQRIGQREGIASGDANAGRTVTAALRAAGGVRPDADLRRLALERGGRRAMLDLSGILAGREDADLPLMAGDRLIVASTGCFDPALVRPSAVTMADVRVYLSNLGRPANNNAGAAIGKDASSLPYGTRLLQALVGMNCVGGSAMNAHRRAVLISRNPMTGASVVVERDVERLVRGAERDTADPYLMPGDGIACYDSRRMNFQDAVSLVSGAASIATPAILLRNAG